MRVDVSQNFISRCHLARICQLLLNLKLSLYSYIQFQTRYFLLHDSNLNDKCFSEFLNCFFYKRGHISVHLSLNSGQLRLYITYRLSVNTFILLSIHLLFKFTLVILGLKFEFFDLFSKLFYFFPYRLSFLFKNTFINFSC